MRAQPSVLPSHTRRRPSCTSSNKPWESLAIVFAPSNPAADASWCGRMGPLQREQTEMSTPEDAGEQRRPGQAGRGSITELSAEQGGDAGKLELAARDEERELLGRGLGFLGTRHDGGAQKQGKAQLAPPSQHDWRIGLDIDGGQRPVLRQPLQPVTDASAVHISQRASECLSNAARGSAGPPSLVALSRCLLRGR